MAKKKRASKTSKGERVSIARTTISLVRRETPYLDKMLRKVEAWRKGKNPNMTIDGTKYKMNSLYGDPRKINSGDDQ